MLLFVLLHKDGLIKFWTHETLKPQCSIVTDTLLQNSFKWQINAVNVEYQYCSYLMSNIHNYTLDLSRFYFYSQSYTSQIWSGYFSWNFNVNSEVGLMEKALFNNFFLNGAYKLGNFIATYI